MRINDDDDDDDYYHLRVQIAHLASLEPGGDVNDTAQLPLFPWLLWLRNIFSTVQSASKLVDRRLSQS